MSSFHLNTTQTSNLTHYPVVVQYITGADLAEGALESLASDKLTIVRATRPYYFD